MYFIQLMSIVQLRFQVIRSGKITVLKNGQLKELDGWNGKVPENIRFTELMKKLSIN